MEHQSCYDCIFFFKQSKNDKDPVCCWKVDNPETCTNIIFKQQEPNRSKFKNDKR